MNQTREFFLQFNKKEKIGKNATSFYFSRSKGIFDFLPGQYVNMYLPHDNPDEKGTSRFFTIASSPLEKDYVMITTTESSNSTFKRALNNLGDKQQVRFYGPIGKLVLNNKEDVPLVFLAAGIGITPFYSIMTSVIKKKLRISITLIASFSTLDDMIFFRELTKISKTNRNINVIYTITNAISSQQKWAGERGKISKKLIQRYISDMQAVKYYIVGAPEMVEDTRQTLLALGVHEEKMMFENFTGY